MSSRSRAEESIVGVMRKAWSLVAVLALLAVPGAAESRRLPTRAQLERALNAFFACTAAMDCRDVLPFRRRLTSSRCYPDDGTRGRVLCIFSGYNVGGNRIRPARFRHDCAYLMPSRRGWVMIGSPDADLC